MSELDTESKNVTDLLMITVVITVLTYQNIVIAIKTN